MKEGINFKSEHSPGGTQCSEGLVMTQRNHHAPLINCLPNTAVTGQSEEEQEEIMQSDSKVISLVQLAQIQSSNSIDLEGNAISNKTEPHHSIREVWK